MYSQRFVSVTDSKPKVDVHEGFSATFNVAEMFLTTEKARAYPI